MKTNKIKNLFMNLGEDFLIGDFLSWSFLVGSFGARKNDTGKDEMTQRKKMNHDTRARAWIKSIVWRIFGIAILGGISWIVTRDWKEMSSITILFHGTRVLLYYAHERIWERISWGRVVHPLSVFPVKKKLEPEDMKLIRTQLRELGYLD